MNNLRVLACCLILMILVAFNLSLNSMAYASTNSPQGGKELAQLFETRYQAWKVARAEWIQQNPFLSYTPVLPEERAIIDMGPSVVPFIIVMFEQELSDPTWDNQSRSNMLGLISMITWKAFRDKNDWPEGKYGNHEIEMALYVKWWKEGRKETPRKFADLYVKWDQFKNEDKTKEADETLDQIRFMGIEVLPLVIQKISDGDERLLPFINKLMRKNVVEDHPTRESVLKWWQANESLLRFPDPPVDSSQKKN